MKFKLIIFLLLSLTIKPHLIANKKIFWENYYKNTEKTNSPHKTLEIALKLLSKDKDINNKKLSVDLGAGTGRDTLHLLNNGLRVLSIDKEQKAIDIILKKVKPNLLTNLETQVVDFCNMKLPKDIDLINASLSLPFCNPKSFPSVWENIVDHIKPGGIFSGHFFGNNDEWAKNKDRTHHTKKEVLKLFDKRFEIEHFEESEGPGKLASGKNKYWHIFYVVAKKQ